MTRERPEHAAWRLVKARDQRPLDDMAQRRRADALRALEGIPDRRPPTDLPEWSEWPEEDDEDGEHYRASRDEAWRTVLGLIAEAKELAPLERLERKIIPSDQEFNRESTLDESIHDQIDDLLIEILDMGYHDPMPDWVPDDWHRAIPGIDVPWERRAKTTARDPFEDVLRKGLTPDERRHWKLFGKPQREVKEAFGISQQMVSKREKALRAKIDDLHIEWNGKPYPWVPAATGGRRRRL
jgi:hypothetical protein